MTPPRGFAEPVIIAQPVIMPPRWVAELLAPPGLTARSTSKPTDKSSGCCPVRGKMPKRRMVRRACTRHQHTSNPRPPPLAPMTGFPGEMPSFAEVAARTPPPITHAAVSQSSLRGAELALDVETEEVEQEQVADEVTDAFM